MRGAGAAGLVAAVLVTGRAGADGATETGDAISYRVKATAVAQLYRRQTFPDPSGALVEGGMAAPLFHTAYLEVNDADAPWRDDSIDMELAAWGNLELGEVGPVGRLDGDVQIARVRHRLRHGYVSLGRQMHAGGAARFVRFDGAAAGARASWPGDDLRTELGVDGYGGFTVLPRWSTRPGYHLLGSAADELLRSPEALPEPDRADSWVAGGRMYVSRPGFATAGASFHEEQENGGLGRRNAALDIELVPIRQLAYRGLAIADIDGQGLSEVRTSLDTYPLEELGVSATYQHLSPALLLSRQSVLSVFSTETFDEWGLESDVRPLRWLRLDGFGFVQRFENADLGTRAGGRVRFIGGGALRPVTGLGYRRVVETENGYHGLRASFGINPIEPLTVTTEGYLYLYDAPIAGIANSMVGVLSTGWRAHDLVGLWLAGSLARSPYASLDAQATTRVSFEIDGGAR